MEPDHTVDWGQSSEKGEDWCQGECGGVPGWEKLVRASRRLEGLEGVREKGELADNSNEWGPFLWSLQRKILFIRN